MRSESRRGSHCPRPGARSAHVFRPRISQDQVGDVASSGQDESRALDDQAHFIEPRADRHDVTVVEGLMTAVSAVSDVSQHVAKVGCFVDTQNPVLKQARFLYSSSTYIALFPAIFVAIMYVYWLWLVPVPCVGECLACGRKKTIFVSDPVPNVVRKTCCRGSGCCSGTAGRIQAKTKKEDSRMVGNPIAHNRKQRSHRRAASRRRSAMELVLKDERIKTRDIFSYSTVLFFYMLYPSLCRTSMDILSCQNPHSG